jgi:hypothetical protein
MSNVESTVLARELGKLGGGGAKWVGKLLPSVPFEKSFELSGTLESASHLVSQMLKTLGGPIPELPSQPERGSFCFLMGAGNGCLNPTIVYIRLEPFPPNTRVAVRAVAKEGLVKQRTAQGAVERVEGLLRENAA